MKTCIIILFSIFSFLPAISSAGTTDSSSNPVIFFETILGHSYGRTGGLALGLNLNYQVKNVLVTARLTETTKMRFVMLSPFIPFPFIEPKSNMQELALLCGWRVIKEKMSYSFSIGISRNQFEVVEKANNQYYEYRSRFIGVPFEANLKLFHAEKRRYRLMGIIPTGQNPIAFGRSVGFKLFANFSEHTMAGIGMTFGFGTHKKF